MTKTQYFHCLAYFVDENLMEFDQIDDGKATFYIYAHLRDDRYESSLGILSFQAMGMTCQFRHIAPAILTSLAILDSE